MLLRFSLSTKLGYVIAIISVIIDQITKFWVLDALMTPPRFIAVTPFFNLVLAWNSGVSFGLFNNNGNLNSVIFSLLAICIIVILLFWLYRTKKKYLVIGLGLIIGGAIGNVIDRLLYGAVIDFIDLHLFNYHWPAFNAADSFITIGAIILIYDSLFSSKQK